MKVFKYIREHWLSLGLILVFLGVLLYQRLPLYLSDRTFIGKAAPDFELATLSQSAEPVRLSELQGRKVLITFWATWCAICVREMPALGESYRELSGRGLTIIALTDEEPDRVQQYLEENPVPFPVLHDDFATVGERYGVRVLPTMVWVDENGIVTDVSHGAQYLLSYELRHWVTGGVL
ncbi:MAG: TlpA family protein disulfide reductase [Spirochaetales bacterium]|nr:TlpA family protein disulfide reductase [Leptospiraceae bacterium]MCP5480898.1 TlpA family protein disulfide reductase [Spirochaetales bacterium]MCP5485278.1 TlpA family protein disulfide reductase [Spirochaetales bacterium]